MLFRCLIGLVLMVGAMTNRDNDDNMGYEPFIFALELKSVNTENANAKVSYCWQIEDYIDIPFILFDGTKDEVWNFIKTTIIPPALTVGGLWAYWEIDQKKNEITEMEITRYEQINRWNCKEQYPDVFSPRISNGVYVSKMFDTFTYLDKITIIPPMTFSPCRPGTWFTCKSKPDCDAVVPVYSNNWDGGDNMYMIKASNGLPLFPIEECYPCEDGVGMGHYVYAGNLPCTGVADHTHAKCKSELSILPHNTDEWKRVVCYGSFFPPMLCPLGSEAKKDRSACACVAGKFWDGFKCETCPVAHFCVEGIPTLCGDDTYNYQTGQSTCSDCLTVNTRCDSGFTLAKCSYANDPKNYTYITRPICVSCLRCTYNVLSSTNYTTLNQALNFKSTPGMYVDCYEDNM